MQAVKKSKKYLLNQQVINFIEIGMDIAVTKKKTFRLTWTFMKRTGPLKS
jgi:hypothetical protein